MPNVRLRHRPTTKRTSCVASGGYDAWAWQVEVTASDLGALDAPFSVTDRVSSEWYPTTSYIHTMMSYILFLGKKGGFLTPKCHFGLQHPH
jgi:hypothetical protein